MTLDQIRYALEVQRLKNFSRAAEACHITQPSLSVQIAKLEEELGLTLFDRSKTHVHVTDYGETVLKQARIVYSESLRLREIASELKGEVQGRFRLGIIPTLAPSLLPLFISQFSAEFPKVHLSVIEETTDRLIHQIDDGAIDGAILSTPSKSPAALMERVLFFEPFVLYASTGHEILSRKKVAPEDIASGEMLLLDEAHCLRDQVLQLCKKQKEGDQKLQITSGSLQTLIEVLRRQSGYTLLPQLAVSSLTENEQKKNVRYFDKPVPARRVSLVFHKAHLKRSVIEALRKTISETLPKTVMQTGSRDEVRVLSPAQEHFEI